MPWKATTKASANDFVIYIRLSLINNLHVVTSMSECKSFVWFFHRRLRKIFCFIVIVKIIAQKLTVSSIIIIQINLSSIDSIEPSFIKPQDHVPHDTVVSRDDVGRRKHCLVPPIHQLVSQRARLCAIEPGHLACTVRSCRELHKRPKWMAGGKCFR